MENTKSFDDWKRETLKKIESNIAAYLSLNSISEHHLAEMIAAEYGIKLHYSNVNNALTSGSKHVQLSLPLALAISKVLHVPLEAFYNGDWANHSRPPQTDSHDEIAARLFDVLCNDAHRHYDSAHAAFQNLIGQYHCYFWPTDSTSKNPHHAILDLTPRSNLCEAIFELKYHNNQKKKVYTGYAFTTDANICFCLLRGKSNVATGELCFLAFEYFSINSGSLPIALAEALSVTAGSPARAPVVHRMLLSRREIEPSAIDDINPCISLYPPQLYVEEDIVARLSLSDIEKRVLTKAVSASLPAAFIRLSELIIKGIGEQQGLTSSQVNSLLHKVRQVSAKKNNDIITSEDQQLAYDILADNPQAADTADTE